MPIATKTKRNAMIRRLRTRNPKRWTFRALANKFGVHVKTVWDIVTRTNAKAAQ